ncbi:MAG: DUF3090 family protein [Candidatus Rokuibacteriota bacterium]
MSDSFDFKTPAFFTVGAVGLPGQRVFYLQAGESPALATLKLEKEQVGALAEYLAGMLAKLPAVRDDVDQDLALREPVAAAWVVGSLGVAYDEARDRILIVAEELMDEEAGGEAASARFHVSRAQARAFVERARELVKAGRPSCRICGHRMDPDGHVCPRSNGHVR